MSCNCVKQIPTTRVNYYTPTNLTTIPFTLLSRKFKILKQVSQIGRDWFIPR